MHHQWKNWADCKRKSERSEREKQKETEGHTKNTEGKQNAFLKSAYCLKEDWEMAHSHPPKKSRLREGKAR